MSPWKSLIFPAVLAIAAPAVAQSPTLATVSAINLNMRTEADASSDIVTVVPQGSLLIVQKQDGPWFHVRYLKDDIPKIGWVHGNHIELVSNTPAPQRKTAPPPTAPAPTAPIARLPNPMQVRATDFDCDEGYSGDGYEDCTVEIRVVIDLPSVYDPYYTNDIGVKCESRVEYSTSGSFMSSSDDESESGYVHLSSGYGSTTIEIEHDFGYSFEPITNARLESVSCRPTIY